MLNELIFSLVSCCVALNAWAYEVAVHAKMTDEAFRRTMTSIPLNNMGLSSSKLYNGRSLEAGSEMVLSTRITAASKLVWRVASSTTSTIP